MAAIESLGRKVSTVYDDLNRKTGEIWKTSAGAEVQRQTWAYDFAGRLAVAADPDGVYTVGYDGVGRATAVQEPFGQVLTMGCDFAGRRTRVQDSQGGVGGKATYSYDARGLQTGSSRFSSSAGTTLIGVETQSYDSGGRLTGITQKNGSNTVLWSGTYTYDAGDRLTQKVENGSSTTYGYDAEDQLIRTNAGATTTYDGTGNRTNSGYATTTGNRSTNDGTWTYTYDDVGNQVTKSKSGESWAYGFDYRNQLVTAAKTVGGTTTRVTYSYDAFGNQIARNDGTNTTWYSVDGWDTSKPQAVGTENFDNWAELNGTGFG